MLAWIETEEQDEVRAILAGVRLEEDPGATLQESVAALNAIEAVWTADDRLRSSLSATAGVALDAYGDPAVAECSVESQIAAGDLLSGSNTVYLCATALAQERLRPLFVTMIDQIVGHIYELSAATGRPIDPPLLIVLDEAANIAPLPRLDQLAATGAGQGIQLVTAVQDLAQLEERWGKKADTILDNHRAKVFGSGLSCEKTLTYACARRRVDQPALDDPGRARLEVRDRGSPVPAARAGRPPSPGEAGDRRPAVRPPSAGADPAPAVVRGSAAARARSG